MNIFNMTLEEAREAGRKDYELLMEQRDEATRIETEKRTKFQTALGFMLDGFPDNAILKNCFNNDLSLWAEFKDWKIKQDNNA